MKSTVQRIACLSVLFALGNWKQPSVAAQNSETGWEDRPKLTAAVELLPRIRLQTWGELQHGWNFSYQRWRTGALISHRLKPIVRLHREDIDEENERYLVLGGGYEYLHTVQDASKKIENRIIAEATPRVLLTRLLLADRNRGEFRWVNGTYGFRYRNRLVISDHVQLRDFDFTPYASGELYYDHNQNSWNQSRYGIGMQFPYKKIVMFDTYLLHQNCTTCSQNPVNMVGAVLNFYFGKVQ